MNPTEQLDNLLSQRKRDLPKWVLGYRSSHYKRMTIPPKRALQLAKKGQTLFGKYFGEKGLLLFTQAVIAGACLTDYYDEVIIVSCSRYGKSWLMGRIALIMALEGEPVLLAHARKDGTKIIMNHTISAIKDIDSEVKKKIMGVDLTKLDRLDAALSKNNISIAGAGSIEPISLGDTFNDTSRSGAVGLAGNVMLDEAAFVSKASMLELRRNEIDQLNVEELSKTKDTDSVTNGKYKFIAISNPHNAGWFYDKLVAEKVPKGKAVIWMDALTAVEEGRWAEDEVRNSEFNTDPEFVRKYWLCELPQSGDSLFPPPKVVENYEEPPYSLHFLGVDSAYQGKDNISVAHIIMHEDATLHVAEVFNIKKPALWMAGKSGDEVIEHITNFARYYSVSRLCIDMGAGSWLNEGLAKRYLPIRGVYFNGGVDKSRVKAYHSEAKRAGNARAEMHLDLQSLMFNNKITFSKQAADSIAYLLPLITMERRNNGTILVRPKSEIKALLGGKSPDALDSVLLGVRAALTFYQN